MAYCYKCGTQLPDDAAFCSSCGTAQDTKQRTNNQSTDDYAQQFQDGAEKVFDSVRKLNDTPDHSCGIDPQDVKDNKLFSILSYIGLLVLIPIFAAPKNSRFARFHANQGLVLLICNLVYSVIRSIISSVIRVPRIILGIVVYTTPEWLTTILSILSIPFLVLMIIGIVNAANGKCKELPVIGKIKLLKDK